MLDTAQSRDKTSGCDCCGFLMAERAGNISPTHAAMSIRSRASWGPKFAPLPRCVRVSLSLQVQGLHLPLGQPLPLPLLLRTRKVPVAKGFSAASAMNGKLRAGFRGDSGSSEALDAV